MIFFLFGPKGKILVGLYLEMFVLSPCNSSLLINTYRHMISIKRRLDSTRARGRYYKFLFFVASLDKPKTCSSFLLLYWWSSAGFKDICETQTQHLNTILLRQRCWIEEQQDQQTCHVFSLLADTETTGIGPVVQCQIWAYKCKILVYGVEHK